MQSEDLTLQPAHDLTGHGTEWESTGNDPFFTVISKSGDLPTGWVIARLKAYGSTMPLSPTIYADDGHGFRQTLSKRIFTEQIAPRGTPIRLPDRVTGLRLDPLNSPGRFQIISFELHPISRIGLCWFLLAPMLDDIRKQPGGIFQYIRRGIALWRAEGARSLAARLLASAVPDGSYSDWVRLYDTLSTADMRGIGARLRQLAYQPLISVVIPAYNTDSELLRKCLESVRGQLYKHWEICIVDDASSHEQVAMICRHYSQLDKRIKFKRLDSHGHISRASNAALEMASGEYVALLDHDDELAPHALYMAVEYLDANRELDMLFSDEDKIDSAGKRFDPWFKSDWNYDLMLSQNVAVHLCIYRRRIVQEIGGFRIGFEGSQDYDLTLRFVERVGPARVCHIPFILYHWRVISGSTALESGAKPYAFEAGRNAIQEHLNRTGKRATVERQAHDGCYRVRWERPDSNCKVSIIIPTKDKAALLQKAVDSILQKTDYPNLDITVVDNESVEEATSRLFESWKREPRIRVLKYEQPFNFSALNNWAVRQCDGALIAFVNNDVEIISPEWLTEMASLAMRSEVGAVGAKLYYPNDAIQHAGIVVGIGGLAGNPHQGMARAAAGYFCRAICTQDYSAVTAACLVTRRHVFDEIGGFDEEDFKIAFNDVDLCLRLRERGYLIVWTPFAELYHYESASLGLPETEQRRAEWQRETRHLRSRWHDVLRNDPYYNPNLSLENGYFTPANPPRVSKPWM